jgi:hypothetical protein
MTRFTTSIIASAVLTASLGLSQAHANSEYEAWLKQTQGEFQNYLDENDKAFLNFLNKKWEEVEVEKPKQRDPKPKPVVMPKAPVIKEQPVTAPEVADKEKPKPVVIKPVVIEKPKPQPKPVISKPIASKPNERSARFEFFGSEIKINYDRKFKQDFYGSIDNKRIAGFWKKLASQPHKNIVEQLTEKAKELKLNDWGTALLFDQFAREVQSNANARQLTTWFLLVKAGFNARVAYNNQVFLLIPSKQQLFGVTYFTLGGERYYAVGLNERSMKPGKVFTYSGSHSDGQRDLDFSQPNQFIASKNRAKRDLSFSYQDKKFNISVDYPKDMVNYFNTFPQLELSNYFAAGMPSDTAYQLLNQLKPVVEGQSEEEAVNRLLRFVQTAFEYKTDDDQFRQENYLFPLETLHYPYSDCEDRAALFAWLVKSLLKLDVAILDFPGHIATAVAFNQPVKGDKWKFAGKTYTVADPTYINANAGMTMPQYRGKAPKLVSY